MAVRRNRSAQTARRSSTNRETYIYGNTVRQAEVMPRRREYEEELPRRQKKVSPQVRKNRKQALRMNPVYVMFLTIAAVVALAVCVWYIQVRSELTKRSEQIAVMQEELAEMKEENTTRYNSIVDSVNLEEVRERAINELGMVYANSDQIVEYQNPVSDFVKQYEEIPKDGVLSQSEQMSR